MEKTEQMLVENVGDIQLIHLDPLHLHRETRRKIFWTRKLNHDFHTLPTDIVEGKPAIFYSHRDKMFIEVFIDHIDRFNNGGSIFWHEIQIKLAA